MTDNINSNLSKTLENTPFMFNQNISHNNGNVNLSLFDQPTIFGNLTNDEDLFNQKPLAFDLNSHPHTNPNKTTTPTEETTNISMVHESSDTMLDDKPMAAKPPNGNTNKDGDKTTHDTDGVNPAKLQTNNHHHITPTDREALITKMKYHYGRRQSITPSNFKKFQPPFANGPKTNDTTPDTNFNNFEKMIVNFLQEKNDKMGKDNQPSLKEGLFKIKQPEQHNLKHKDIDKTPSDTTYNKQKSIYTHIDTNNLDYNSEETKTTETRKSFNPNDDNGQSSSELEHNPHDPQTNTNNKNTNESNTIHETNPYINYTIDPSHGQYIHTTSPHPAAIRNLTPIAAYPKPPQPIITPNIPSGLKQTLTHEIISTTKTPPYNPYKQNTKLFDQNMGSNNYPLTYTPNQFHSHNNNLDNIQYNNRLTLTHNLPPLIQTSKDSTTKIQNLTTELEPLSKVIMSQHNALSQHIIDLGTICLNCTHTIEKKKNSSIKLIKEGNIPRSLRIKCELTTSPDFENDPNYLVLKQKLQDAVSRFTTTGLEIMQDWSKININLLIKERCHKIMKKTITILDGLFSYWSDVIGPANWSQTIGNNILLILLKIYFETEYIPDTSDILNYLEMTPNEILLLAARIITKNNDDIYNQSVLLTIDQIELNFTHHNSSQLHILQETLSSFNAILRATTIELWEINSQRLRESEASLKLKAKLDSERTASATIATTKAIDKALEIIDVSNNNNQATQLRILNLEKQLLKQNQTSNEILNHLKSQKNSKGSHQRPMTSPPNPFLQKRTHKMDHTMASSTLTNQDAHTNLTKRRKGIQWEDNHVTEYNTTTMPIQTFAHSHLFDPSQYNPTKPYPDTTQQILNNQLSHQQLNAQQQKHQSNIIITQQESTPQIMNNPFLNFQPKPSTTNRRFPGARSRGRRKGF
jgi:hypothetical protein